jgi:hypothetical protein
MTDCLNCGREWPEDRFNRTCQQPDWCFACRSKTLRVAFQGGKEYFHESTEKERSDKAVAEARAAGFDPVPMETGKGWNGAAGSTLKKIGDVSKKAGAFGGKPAVSAGF